MNHGAVGNGNSGPPAKNLSSMPSSSSVASSLYEDPIELEPRKSNVDAASVGLPPRQSPSPHSDDASSIQQPADVAAMQSPTRQAMDRVDNNDPAAFPSAYRIPDYVFARNISTAPYEWSVASNESLFSIHPGNMSFTADQLSYKSGELGLPGEYIGSPADFKSNRPPTPTNKSMELTTSKKSDSSNIGMTEAAAAETMREVIRETEEDPSKVKPVPAKELSNISAAPAPSLESHCSKDSMGSVKSFAFPVLSGVDKSNSLRPGTKSKQGAPPSQPETPKGGSPEVVPLSQPENDKATLKESKETPPENAAAANKKWCPCLPCCPF